MESKKKERTINIEIYTDGSLKKIGPMTFGGWAFIATRDNQEFFVKSGQEGSTTNQRMELTAIVEALEYIKNIRRTNEKVVIYSDSAYAVECYLKEWYLNWYSNGWINSNGKEVANKDLWLRILPFFDNFWYDFKKVKGHNNDYWNERCDKIAQTESQNLKSQWRGINGV